MNLMSLGYMGINTRSVADWREFGTRLLGLQECDATSRSISFRLDDHAQRIFVDQNGSDGVHCLGWEVADAIALDIVTTELECQGIRFARAQSSLVSERRVADLVIFTDPAGNRIEIFHGPERVAKPFEPGRAISGFRTGSLGLGHAVLMHPHIEPLIEFYTQVLGFRLSDYALKPFKAYFFHLNSRHHSLAIIESEKSGLHHLMLELQHLDDVGQGYDLALLGQSQIAATLGRHANDLMTSFYCWSPSKFMVEYGWGGRDICPETWEATELKYGPSLWGHDRSWLGETKRLEALDLRLAAASNGLRAPR